MTKPKYDAAVATIEAHGDEMLLDRADAQLVPAEPQPTGENTEQAPVKRRAAGSRSKDAASGQTKTEIVLKKLRSSKGATIAQLGEATGWQAHSVRGFLSAMVRKKLGLNLVSDVGKDGVRRYRVEGQADSGSTDRPE